MNNHSSFVLLSTLSNLQGKRNRDFRDISKSLPLTVMNFNVRYTFLTALSLAMFLASFSQPDSLRKKTIWLRPSVENGISFIRNEYLKNAFNTNSTYNWGFGVRFGNGAKNDLLPFVQYSNSKYTGRHIFSNNQRMDSILRIREIIAGFVFPVKRFGYQTTNFNS